MQCQYCGSELTVAELDAHPTEDAEGTRAFNLSGSCDRCGTRNVLSLGNDDYFEELDFNG